MNTTDTPLGRRTWWQQLGRDITYLLPSLPLAISSFTAVITLFSVAIGTVVIWIGVPIGVLMLAVARWFANLERVRLGARSDALPAAVYLTSPPGTSSTRKLLNRFRDRQAWLDVAHAIVTFPLVVTVWSLAVTWLFGSLGGMTYWFWGSFIPDDPDERDSLSELLDLPISEWQLQLIIGAVLLVTLVPVIRGLAALQATVSESLLVNERAIELQRRVEQLTLARAAAADAEVDSMRRLERDIHDGPQQRLVRLGMDLAAVERRMDDDPETARRLVGEAREHTNAALNELRALSRGIAPPMLADRGLPAAIGELAATSPVPVTLEIGLRPGERLPQRVETAAYFTIAEALTNTAKHAHASAASIRLTRRPGQPERLQIEIRDNGVGGADSAKGHGLAGLRERLGRLDGTLTVDSPDGGPTLLAIDLPCDA